MNSLFYKCLEEDVWGQNVHFEETFELLKIFIVTRLYSDVL